MEKPAQPRISRRTFLIGSTHLMACMIGLAGGHRTVAAAQQKTVQSGGYGTGAYGRGTYASVSPQFASTNQQRLPETINSIYLPIVTKMVTAVETSAEEANSQVWGQSTNKIYLPVVTNGETSQLAAQQAVNVIYLPHVTKEEE